MTSNQTLYRDTWAEINLDAIAHNVHTIQHHIGPYKKIMAVVKANAYGHGAVAVAQAALLAGATHLGVATLDEAIMLRTQFIDAPILVLGYAPPKHATVAASHHIILTVVSTRHAEQLASFMKNASGIQLNVHLKIDSGMSRLGIRNAKELMQAVTFLSNTPSIQLTGAFTHFAESDADHLNFTYEQLQLTNQLFELLKQHVTEIDGLLFHAANSGGILQVPESHYDMVRLGISLYGVYPSHHLRKNKPLSLIQALKLKSRIALVKEVPSETPISYGSTFVTNHPMRIATIPIGYGDGIPRILSNRGYFLLQGVRCAILGRICMDQTIIDVSDFDNVQEGDEVIIYNEQTLPELSDLSGTIPYELLCAIAPRVPRLYDTSQSHRILVDPGIQLI